MASCPTWNWFLEAGASGAPLTVGYNFRVGDFTILLVEDDFDVREALAEALRDEGYIVDCAVDGEQALDYLHSAGPPGLILLDLMMPRMSGSEFRMLQKVDPRLSDLPVVLLTADARMEEKARALETDGAIRKPIDLDELLATIARFNKTAS